MSEHLTPPPRSSIRDWPEEERPRERLLSAGPAHLSDGELLAIFLGSGYGGRSAVDLARERLREFGSLQQVVDAVQRDGQAIGGFGPARRAMILAALELARRTVQSRRDRGIAYRQPADAAELLQHHLYGRDREVVCALFLDTRHRLLALEDLFFGTIDGAAVYPREVVRRALAVNAGAVILAHNHPSGDCEPSRADINITRQLFDALKLVDVRLIDHIVIGGGDWASLALRGLMP